MKEDTYFMDQTLSLAQKARGYTSPNPMVGAVLVKNGRIIGKGYHLKYGGKHAEIIAIEESSVPVKGATLYCNMEPCSHTTPEKHNPPCVQRIIKEGIKRVVLATIDPNPHVSGRGIDLLRSAGIEVKIGVRGREATFLNEVYFKYIQRKEPFVELKIAQSLDGRIATKTGESKWITDEEARRIVRRMRAQYDAVLIGRNTVHIDDPSLTVRYGGGKQPFRIVLDRSLSIPESVQVVTDRFRDKTIIITSPSHNQVKRTKLEKRGVKVIEVQEDSNGFLHLKEIMIKLLDFNITSILVEGGSTLFTQFIVQRLFDKVSIFIAPLIIGRGIDAIGELNILKVSHSLYLDKVRVMSIGDQVLVQGYRDVKYTFGKLSGGL